MGEMNELRVFTAEEANRLLPQLTEMILQLQAKQHDILAKEAEIDALEILYPRKNEKTPSPEVTKEIEAYNEEANQFYELLDQIHGMGCFLKDIDSGLVDFYTLYQERVVYLCWKLGESEVGFWHEVGRGYAYRQSLMEEDEKESSG